MTVRLTALLGAASLVLVVPHAALAQDQTAAPAEQDWIATSNAYTLQLMLEEAEFSPEGAAANGLEQFDGKAIDLGPNRSERFIAMERGMRTKFAAALASESDPQVKQDLQILIDSIDQSIEGTQLSDRLELSWFNAPQFVFGRMNRALDKQLSPARQAKALELLERYTGLYPGTTPLTELAKARWEESLGEGKVGPYKGEVEDTLGKTETLISGIHALFDRAEIEGADEALATLDKQIRDYAEWERANVLPKARDDFRLPPELYAYSLKAYGIDITPQDLMARARRGFYDTRNQMIALAPQVAAKFGFEQTDYLSVIKALKKDTIPDDQLESFYGDVLGQIDAMLVEHEVIDIPEFPVLMRLGSPAENAVQPAPHMQPPRLIGNTGERGQFVLGTGDPSAGPDAAYDDFNFKAASWTLSAHEARPGHELQFASMVERGVSQARALYAFNSVNAEGWGLYAEAEFMPYEPIEGQMIALQFLLLRESRAMLDPMLNLGMITPAEATKWLREEVGLSVAMTKQEVDRYTFRGPGQAGSYFYGYGKLSDLRMETEIKLGDKFDRKAFNDFVIAQGLLPLDQLAEAVRSDFIPAMLAR